MEEERWQKLEVWKHADELAFLVYKVTKDFPKEELYGLTSQFRRAAVSVPANLAEGFKRVTIPDKLRFFNIAQSSLEEVRYYLILVYDLKYADTRELKADLEEVSRMLEAYRGSIKKNR